MITVQVGNPFPGLRPFREDEEHLFFGRESQIHSIIDKLSATRFLAVVGNSGSGKSSLVNCGLRPALHRGLMAKAGTCWRMAQFRPGGNPLRALARTLAKDGLLFSGFDSSTLALEDIIEASLRMSKMGLSRVYSDAHLPEGTNLLVIVDQFEELFRYREPESSFASDAQHRGQEATAFVSLLLDARTQTKVPIYVALTMRSDFLGNCAEFAGLPEAVNEGEYLIPRLTREERRSAIVGPVGVGGADISPVLLTRLINDVGDNQDQLSILQHALNRTWARWENEAQGKGALDLDHYEAIGTMAHALDQHAEKAYRELPGDREQKICEKIFKALTDKGTDPRGIRRPTKFRVLYRLAGASPEEVTEVLKVFRKPSRSFVMPPLPESLDDDSVIDISHESLMRIWERLIVWSDEEAQSAQLYRRLSETAALHAVNKAGLWNDPDLQSALDWKEKEQPTELWAELYGGNFNRAMSFLSKSQAQRDKEQQEKEQQRQRELQQAQDLAAERQQRIQEQTIAAGRLRKWLVALVIVAAFLLVACIGARLEWRKAKDAAKAANDAKIKADAATAAAIEQKQAADTAKRQAQERLQQAEMADKEMQLEGLRVRDTNLATQSVLADLADALLTYSDPQQSAKWKTQKGEALLSQGNYDEARESFSQVLESFPGDENARTARGYVLFLSNQPKDALKDFEYIRDNVDRGSPLNNLNLSITNAAVGNETAARAFLKEAIDGMRHRDSQGGGEDLIPPEITRATGRATLEASGPTFLAAMHYMQANLEAYFGGKTNAAFVKALSSADQNVKALSPVAQKDAYFVAMTWAWLHLRVNCPHPDEPDAHCKDYGAFASQAALWERAGYKDWAACYYEKFRQKDERWSDKRYLQLALWVKQVRERLGTNLSCQNLRQEEPDVAALEVETREAQARKDYPKAKVLLDQALQKATPAEKNQLLLMKAAMLLAYGRAERQNARNLDEKVEAVTEQIEAATAAKKREEESLPNQKKSEVNTSSGVPDKSQIEATYDRKLAALQADLAQAKKERQQHSQAAMNEFKQLKQNCTDLLKINPTSATVYIYRALAEDWLFEPREIILHDVQHSLRLDPDNPDALSLLDALVPDGEAEETKYLQDNRQLLKHFYKASPYEAATVMHQAKLAQQEKQYIEALQLVDTAINMDPSNLSFYGLRAEIQRSLGFTDSQVRHNLADGYRQAAYILKLRGNYPGSADRQEWAALADLAKNHSSDEILCNSDLTTCSITKTVQVNSEWIYSAILKVMQDGEDRKSVEAKIDRGSEDGIVVGSQGDAWSPYAKLDDGHERHIAKLGTSEVLSVEPHSALIRIHVDQPEGDGAVRKQDMVHLKARTPPIATRSSLWEVAKYDATFLDSNDKILVDYDTLYRDETPSLDDELFQRMLNEIHVAGLRYTGGSKPLEKGKFANQSLGQALEHTNIADLKSFVDYLAKYPGEVFGQRWKLYELYAVWVYFGAPSE
jgi:hypothetical protein